MDVDFDLSEPEKAFRDEVRAWLKANAPTDDGGADMDGYINNRRAWQRKLYGAGYVGMTWPKEYGGRGRSFMYQLIFNDEMILAHAPEPINVIGLGMGGPVVIAHGSDEQKRRYLAPLLSAEEIWCQGFSEPNAGSDLSGLQTRAEDKGDHYLVNGQKVWTTLAHVAKWCMLLARERKNWYFQPSPSETCDAGPAMSIAVSVIRWLSSDHISLRIDPSGPGIPLRLTAVTAR